MCVCMFAVRSSQFTYLLASTTKSSFIILDVLCRCGVRNSSVGLLDGWIWMLLRCRIQQYDDLTSLYVWAALLLSSLWSVAVCTKVLRNDITRFNHNKIRLLIPYFITHLFFFCQREHDYTAVLVYIYIVTASECRFV